MLCFPEGASRDLALCYTFIGKQRRQHGDEIEPDTFVHRADEGCSVVEHGASPAAPSSDVALIERIIRGARLSHRPLSSAAPNLAEGSRSLYPHTRTQRYLLLCSRSSGPCSSFSLASMQRVFTTPHTLLLSTLTRPILVLKMYVDGLSQDRPKVRLLSPRMISTLR